MERSFGVCAACGHAGLPVYILCAPHPVASQALVSPEQSALLHMHDNNSHHYKLFMPMAHELPSFFLV